MFCLYGIVWRWIASFSVRRLPGSCKSSTFLASRWTNSAFCFVSVVKYLCVAVEGFQSPRVHWVFFCSVKTGNFDLSCLGLLFFVLIETSTTAAAVYLKRNIRTPPKTKHPQPSTNPKAAYFLYFPPRLADFCKCFLMLIYWSQSLNVHLMSLGFLEEHWKWSLNSSSTSW